MDHGDIFVHYFSLYIVISGLILYQRNATMHLYEILPSKISGKGENSFDMAAGKTAWTQEEHKVPESL